MKRFLIVFGLVIFILASSSTNFAANISKTFEFGPGTGLSISVFRTFSVPCNRQVAAVVKFKRLGPAGSTNDIPITIELREPDTASNQEGPLVKAENVNATTTEQTKTILSPGIGSPRGCDLPWRVRVKANGVTPQFAVTGTIRMDFDLSTQNISIPFTGVLFARESKTINVGTQAGLAQGKFEMTANWHHQLSTVLPGPNPIMLNIQLLDPNGLIASAVSQYSSNEARTDLPAFKLTFQARSCSPGQWKLKITNQDNTDTVALDNATVKFIPGC